MQEGLSAQRIYQDLGAPTAGFGYDSVRRFVRRLGGGRTLPFRRMECGPGEEAQVDFGTGAPDSSAPDGKRRKTHVFRIVLSPLPQGVQRGQLHADDRRLPPLPGERLRALRRRAHRRW